MWFTLDVMFTKPSYLYIFSNDQYVAVCMDMSGIQNDNKVAGHQEEPQPALLPIAGSCPPYHVTTKLYHLSDKGEKT